jgi:serine/threonine protein kinase
MLQTGTVLSGVFEILGPLGSGAMGEVYRARDRKLGREVAIKILPKELWRDPDRLARFEHEARAASALNHPNIVTVHGIEHEGETVYLVLELVQGRTLRDRLARGGMPWRSSLPIAEQIATGLAAAHAGSIVHRDLKPENIMIRDDGVVKILDFGLAKLYAEGAELATATALTSPGAILGTVGYMSPEQARGESVDWRADQFALGCILYEMATGERPFQGASNAQTLTAIIERDPEPVSRNRADAPRPVLWILDRCLAKDPRDRYGSTLDLARDLRNVREHLSTGASDSQAGVTAPPRRGPRWLVPVLGTVAGAVAGLLIGRFALHGSASDPQPPAVRTITFSGQDYCPSASPDGRMLTFVSRRDGPARIWIKSLTDGNEFALTSGPDFLPRFSPDGSTILYIHSEPTVSAVYRIPTVGGEPRRIIADAVDADWSPDGSRIVFLRVSSKGQTSLTSIISARADGADEKVLTTVEDATLLFPRWSTDGKWIAVSAGQFGASEVSGKFFQLVRADGSETKRVKPSQQGGDVSGVVWIDGSRALLYSQGESVTTVSLGASVINSGASRIQLQDLATQRTRVLMWSPSLATTVTLAGPDRLVYDATTSRQNLQEWDISNSSGSIPGASLSQGTSLDRQPVYSPDGQWVVFSSNRSGNLDIWARSCTSGELRRLTDDSADDWDPAFTRDGKQLIWTSRRGGNFEIWMANADGSSPRQVTHDGDDAENATATPDGQWLVYNSANPTKAGVWKVRTDGSQAQRLVDGTTAWPEVSPDGTVAAYAVVRLGSLTQVAFVRIADGKEIGPRIQLDAFEVPNGRSRWLPDGRIAFNWRHPQHPGVYVQDYKPGEDTSASRRPLVQFGNEAVAESFGISPDGKRIAMSASYRAFSLMSASGMPGLGKPSKRSAP